MENDKIIIYQTEDGQTQIDVRLENETVWLTQAQMAELFETDRTSIVRHINNIYKVEELDRESTCAKIAQVQIEGKRTVKRNIPYFNLDMIISVGYRVNSKRGVNGTQGQVSVSLHKRVGRFDSLLRTEEARRECLFKFYEKMTTAKK